jgi:hypothetical protein
VFPDLVAVLRAALPRAALESQRAAELQLRAELHWQRGVAELGAVQLALWAESQPPPAAVARPPTRA